MMGRVLVGLGILAVALSFVAFLISTNNTRKMNGLLIKTNAANQLSKQQQDLMDQRIETIETIERSLDNQERVLVSIKKKLNEVHKRLESSKHPADQGKAEDDDAQGKAGPGKSKNRLKK
jgi:hypothetical protein